MKRLSFEEKAKGREIEKTHESDGEGTNTSNNSTDDSGFGSSTHSGRDDGSV